MDRQEPHVFTPEFQMTRPAPNFGMRAVVARHVKIECRKNGTTFAVCLVEFTGPRPHVLKESCRAINANIVEARPWGFEPYDILCIKNI